MPERITIVCNCGRQFVGVSMGDASERWRKHLPLSPEWDSSSTHEIAHVGRVVYAGGW